MISIEGDLSIGMGIATNFLGLPVQLDWHVELKKDL